MSATTTETATDKFGKPIIVGGAVSYYRGEQVTRGKVTEFIAGRTRPTVRVAWKRKGVPSIIRATDIVADPIQPTLTPSERKARQEQITETFRQQAEEQIEGEYEPTMTATIGRKFWEDHLSRDLPSGRVVSMTADKVTLALDGPHARELWSDAEHYVWLFDQGELDRDWIGLASSARSVVKAMQQALAS